MDIKDSVKLQEKILTIRQQFTNTLSHQCFPLYVVATYIASYMYVASYIADYLSLTKSVS